MRFAVVARITVVSFLFLIAVTGPANAASAFDVYEATAGSGEAAAGAGAKKSQNVSDLKNLSLSATIVFIHGGAWQSGDKSDDRSLAPTFTSAGYRFVSINYPLSSEAKHPAPIAALDKLLSQIPGDKLFLIGHSAGAHMIGFWNSEHTSPRVRGFIGVEGIYDIPKLVAHWPTYGDWFIASEFGPDRTKWPAASPSLLKMKSHTPWLVVHSEKDELVDLAQSSDFVAHLESAKISATLVRLKSGSHFGAVNALADSSSDISQAVLKFVKTNLK